VFEIPSLVETDLKRARALALVARRSDTNRSTILTRAFPVGIKQLEDSARKYFDSCLNRGLNVLVQVGIFAGLTSCLAQFESQRIPAKAPISAEYGFVYQMAKPWFTVAVTPVIGASPAPNYTLHMEKVPGSNQRLGGDESFQAGSTRRMLAWL